MNRLRNPLYTLLAITLNCSTGMLAQNPSVRSLFFQENKGQVYDQFEHARPDVLFSGNTDGLVYHLKANGISFQLSSMTENEEKSVSKNRIYRTDIHWIGTSSNVELLKEGASEYVYHYYRPSCPEGALNVHSYASITYQNIYQGIDLKYYFKDGQLEYDFILEPGASHELIQWEVKGATDLSINSNGDLVIETPLGTIAEVAPLAYQQENIVESRWKLEGEVVSVELGEYNDKLPLIIDPIIRAWGTYFGGSDGDELKALVCDSSSNVYGTGAAESTSGIATSGAHDVTMSGGFYDAFLAKFDKNGLLIWGTYYGGSGQEECYGIALSPSGDLYVAGTTQSTSGIATTGSHSSTYPGGGQVGFLAKFNTSGVRSWGTYFPNGPASSCATDMNSNVYLTGYTMATSGLATSGSHQPVFGGDVDAYLAKFSPSGNLDWATYYGGFEHDEGHDCVVDNANNIYLAGETKSSNAISTVGAHQSNLSATVNALLVKFSANGVRQWGTYYGGNGGEWARVCATDPQQNVYLAGQTWSKTGIATPGTFQDSAQKGVFLVKFNSSGIRQWGTYYGGLDSAEIQVKSCATDKFGNVYLGGDTYQLKNISTLNGHQVNIGGLNDTYLVKFSPNGQRKWATYYGGSNYDYQWGCDVTNAGSIYLGGFTESMDNIATIGTHQSTKNASDRDIFLAKFNQCLVNTNVSQNGSLLTAQASAATYQWATCDSSGLTPIPGATSQSYTMTGNGSYAVLVTQGGCTDSSDCYQINVNGLKEETRLNANLYPNPNKGRFTIDLGKFTEYAEIRLMNIQGLMVESKRFENIQQIPFDISGPSGIYLMLVNTNLGSESFRVIKE